MIEFFKDEYSWLSNFEPVVIYYLHYKFGSVEHAFQASKELTIGPQFFKILKVPADKAGKAKIIGRKSVLRKDWEIRKLAFMENFLRQKYAYPKFRNFLLSTGDEYLIEGNFWHDNFWGDCRCRKCKDKEGENRLGLLTMKVRDSL